MVDFSNISNPPLSHYLWLLRRDGKLETYEYRRAVTLLNPPLLDHAAMVALDYQLSEPLKGPNGRFKRHCHRAGLARQVKALRRVDVPQDFTNSLADHLASPTQTPRQRLDEARSRIRASKTSKRNWTMTAFYEELLKPPSERLPELNKFVETIDERKLPPQKSERALELTAQLLCRLGFSPPDRSTMRNVISKERSRKLAIFREINSR